MEKIEKFIDILYEKSKISSKDLTIGNKSYSFGHKNWLIDLTKDYELLRNIECLDILYMKDDEILRHSKYVKDSLLKEKKLEKIDKIEGGHDVPLARFPTDNYIPIMDRESDKENVLLYCKTLRKLSGDSFEVYKKALTQDEKAILYTDIMRYAIFRYDPYDLRPHYPIEHDGMKSLKVNLYVPPKWRLEKLPEDYKPELPRKIRDFFEHLFPDDEVRAIVYHWIHIALLERNETALVLNAAKGVGKGLLNELLSALVGEDNSNLVQESFFTSQFNSVLLNHRLLLIDEKRITKSEHTRLKRYMNDTQTVEMKGVDVRKKQSTYNNFLITSNDVSDMYIEFDDRRFTVVETTDSPLLDIWSEKEITAFNEEIKENKEMIRDFGHWIIEHGRIEGRGTTEVHRGPRFYHLVYNSLREWQKFILDKIIEEGLPSFTLKQLRKDYKREVSERGRLPNITKITDFLENYLHEGKYVLGSIENREEGHVIAVEDHFITNYDEEIDEKEEDEIIEESDDILDVL